MLWNWRHKSISCSFYFPYGFLFLMFSTFLLSWVYFSSLFCFSDISGSIKMICNSSSDSSFGTFVSIHEICSLQHRFNSPWKSAFYQLLSSFIIVFFPSLRVSIGFYLSSVAFSGVSNKSPFHELSFHMIETWRFYYINVGIIIQILLWTVLLHVSSLSVLKNFIFQLPEPLIYSILLVHMLGSWIRMFKINSFIYASSFALITVDRQSTDNAQIAEVLTSLSEKVQLGWILLWWNEFYNTISLGILHVPM